VELTKCKSGIKLRRHEDVSRHDTKRPRVSSWWKWCQFQFPVPAALLPVKESVEPNIREAVLNGTMKRKFSIFPLGSKPVFSVTCILWGPLWIMTWLTPRSRGLLGKLIFPQLVTKFPVFYGSRKFITLFTSARHCSLSWATCIQSTTSHPISLRSIIISSHLCLGLPSGVFTLGLPTKILHAILIDPCVLHALPISFSLFWSS